MAASCWEFPWDSQLDAGGNEGSERSLATPGRDGRSWITDVFVQIAGTNRRFENMFILCRICRLAALLTVWQKLMASSNLRSHRRFDYKANAEILSLSPRFPNQPWARAMPPRSRTLNRTTRLSQSLISRRFAILSLANLLVGSWVTAPGNVVAQAPTQQQMDEAMQAELPTDPAATIAIVGLSTILMGEISPKVEARIQDVLANAGQEVPENQIKFARVRMTRGLLAQKIQSRMMRESFLLEQVATQTAEKRREADEKMQAKARQMFFEDEVQQLKKQYEAEDLSGLDEKLREKGTSLATRQREFIDAMLGHLYIRGKVNKDPSVSLAEIHGYYHEHLEDFQHQARARWEQLTVLFANFPNKQAAYDEIWNMGREAFFGGSMQAVAREKSQEPFADEGGQHSWTNQGSLASKILEAEIFSLPTGAMSQIIEDTDAYHIVRVLEREEEGVTQLADVQDDIRKILRDQKIEKAQTEALAEVQERVPVWSLFPEDVPGAKPLPRVATRPFPKQGGSPRQ